MHDARGKRGHHEQKFAAAGWSKEEPIRAPAFLAASDLSKSRNLLSAQLNGRAFPNHALVVPENRQQDDDWQRHTEQPQ